MNEAQREDVIKVLMRSQKKTREEAETIIDKYVETTSKKPEPIAAVEPPEPVGGVQEVATEEPVAVAEPKPTGKRVDFWFQADAELTAFIDSERNKVGMSRASWIKSLIFAVRDKNGSDQP